ncbi:MAG TPA: hypothetical protein VK842_03875 [bacterium]|jgi:hypothetical protein|nr:hypothetical protein [bacterium]
MTADDKHHFHHRGRGHSANYGLGAVGAAVYYVQNSVGFWGAILGVLKGLVWPALLVYHVFETLKY